MNYKCEVCGRKIEHGEMYHVNPIKKRRVICCGCIRVWLAKNAIGFEEKAGKVNIHKSWQSKGADIIYNCKDHVFNRS